MLIDLIKKKNVINVLEKMKEDTFSLAEIKKVLCKINIQESLDNSIYDIENTTSPKTILWTYDTGSSEYITNNNSILENFKSSSVTMKCVNK